MRQIVSIVLFASSTLGSFAAGLSMQSPDTAWPMSYLTGFGPRAYPVLPLTWAMLVVSIAVVLVVATLVVVGIFIRRQRSNMPEQALVRAGAKGLIWIYVGLALTIVPLAGAMVWTVVALAKVNSPPAKPDLTIQITGHQWWWEVRYLNDDASRTFTTANEIHIPVGKPVRVRLASADVIHSFWVPSLSGKMQLIPGQTNVTWIQADRVGRYRGQCTQFCGEQHAHMMLSIVADEPGAFDKWLADQSKLSTEPADEQLATAEHSFVFHCGACHSVRGTLAGGVVAPNLSHLMTRSTLAAGALPNTTGNLSAWIADPQSIKPGAFMPVLYLSGQNLHDISSYLETLK